MQIVGLLIFYAQAIDYTMLVALIGITPAQKMELRQHKNKHKHYSTTASHTQAKQSANKKIQVSLHIYRNKSYLSEAKTRSRVGGHLYLGKKPIPSNLNIHNRPILSIYGIIKI